MAPLIDDNDRGPLVNVGLWISLVAACLAAATKVCTKLALGRRLFMDDVYMLLALVSFDTSPFVLHATAIEFGGWRSPCQRC